MSRQPAHDLTRVTDALKPAPVGNYVAETAHGRATSYLGALAYWVLNLAWKVTKPQKISALWASFLLLVGTTEANRGELMSFVVTESRPEDHQ